MSGGKGSLVLKGSDSFDGSGECSLGKVLPTWHRQQIQGEVRRSPYSVPYSYLRI